MNDKYETFYTLFADKYEFKSMETIRPLLADTISIIRTIEEDEKIPVGSSKFGGNPDLPKGMVYPFVDEEIAYTFVMQINCAEVVPFDKQGCFPKSGMLYLFQKFEYEELTLSFDFEPDELEEFYRCAHIVHYDGNEELVRVERPENEHALLIESARIGFVPSYTLPCPYEQGHFYEKVGITDEDELDVINKLQTALYRLPYETAEDVIEMDLEAFYDKPVHQLFGYPDGYQGAVDVEVEVLLKDFEDGDKEPVPTQHLFQLSVDEDINLWWAADGAMYYFIAEEDFKNGVFSRVCHTMQCG